MKKDHYAQNCNSCATESDPVRENSNSAYGKWLRGWTDGGGWTGAHTIKDAFSRAQGLKDAGVS